MSFERGDRTYHLSDERLQAFRALPIEEKLRWVEELAEFIRLTRTTGTSGDAAHDANTSAAHPSNPV